MPLYHLLVPTDFSACSLHALRYATAPARGRPPALLTLLHVDAGTLPAGDSSAGPLGAPALIRQAKLQVADQAANAELLIEDHIVQGDAVENIIAFAKEHEVDAVVMGTHGRKGLDRLLVGSVAAAVLRRAPCPVLFVKPAALGEPMPERAAAAR